MPLICLLLNMALNFDALAQVPVAGNDASNAVTHNFSDIINDTSYVRILDGLVIKPTEKLQGLESIKYIKSKEEKQLLGLQGIKKPVLLISEYDKTSFEENIYKSLYSSNNFIKQFKFPLDLRLPLVIDGVLITRTKREILGQFVFSKQMEIAYAAKSKYQGYSTPFGYIDIKATKAKN